MQQRDQNNREENFRIFHNNTATAKTTNRRNSADFPSKSYPATSSLAPTALQLTPLWEHILRTRKIPETISPNVMFAEFLERLQDPEWQVRQHALRVFVDVLVVMKSKADAYMESLISQLIENLGHQAPTVRKGALDCLRVYLAETAMPETIMLEILDIGLNQKITNEPFGGRLTCGVMLSLPALVQTILHTTKSKFILKTTIDMLIQRMGQVTHQEITLKVLRKIRELITDHEFIKHMSHGAYREFELLCSVYGLSGKDDGLIQPPAANFISSETKTNTWRLIAANKPMKPANCWRSSDEENIVQEKQCLNDAVLSCPAKVIMETEIKINDDTVTMRILEAKDDDICVLEPDVCNKSLEQIYANSLEDEVICGRLNSAKSLREPSSSLVKLLSDSDEIEEERPQHEFNTTILTPSTPLRTLKRVTFGGEIVKLRTPDSDANSATNSNNPDSSHGIQELLPQVDKIEDNYVLAANDNNIGGASTFILQSPRPKMDTSKTSVLTLDIPNDNTKPLIRPKTGTTVKTAGSMSKSPTQGVFSQTNSPKSSRDSPKSPVKRLTVSPVDKLISPRTAHKEIEVLHNLQRDPSPRAPIPRRTSLKPEESNAPSPSAVQSQWANSADKSSPFQESPASLPPPQSWEELAIVRDETILALRSGNWRHRLQGILQLEQALKSSDNLATVQPCLDSLLRTLLSSECRVEVAEEKHKLLINLITRLPLDNLEDRTMQIMSGLCRQGGTGANRVCKALMQRLPTAAIILKLISQDFLHAKSSRFREHALQMVIFSLMTFPSTCFDAETCITNATYSALNRKRRVRLAALEVLAVLGQISSGAEVLAVVQQIASSRDDGAALLAAVKTRLSRKQLPLVSSEGAIQYALHVPLSQLTSKTHDNEAKLKNENNINSNSSIIINENFNKATEANGQQGPDIDWIALGIGSVSPTSLKRRAQKNISSAKQSFTQRSNNNAVYKPDYRHSADLLQQSKTFENEDRYQNNYNFHHVFVSNPYNYALPPKKSNGDHPYITTKRLVANSCSDSSVDGRSSDSNYTSSGSSVVSNDVPGKGGGGDSCGDGISGRFTRQTVNSRFPSMDMNRTYRVHKPPIYYPGMGAYAHLQQQQYNMNSTYPKVNYTLKSQAYQHSHLSYRRKLQTHYQHQQHKQQQQHQEQSPPYYYANNNTNRIQHFNNQNVNATTSTTHKINCGNPEPLKMTESRSQRDLNGCGDNLDGTYTISPSATKIPAQQETLAGAESNARRLINIDKFASQSNKSSQTTNGNEKCTDSVETAENTDGLERQPYKTPTPSLNSTSYSLKSTASAQSSNESRSLKENFTTKHVDEETPKPQATLVGDNDNEKSAKSNKHNATSPLTTVDGKVTDAGANMETANASISKWGSGESILKTAKVIGVHNFEKESNERERAIERDGSLGSLQSKTESIKTQLDDTPPVISRAQSTKSLVTEENIEDNTSFVVVEDVEEIREVNAQADGSQGVVKPNSAKSRPSTGRSQSPTIEEIKALSRRNSIAKSMESLYERPPLKHEFIDNTTETSSQSSAQLNSSTASSLVPLKTHTPLQQKSKTTHFLRSHRKVSPVKQSIKMVQAELFPSTLQRFEKPRESLMKTFDQLDATSWEVVILGLKNMVRLMRYHPEYLDPQMHMVCIQLTRSVRNLRSQVARAACTATTELFILKSRYLEQECDDLVCALLHRTADTNRFIRADATRALESMCDNLTPPKILNILTNKGALHQNALVRTTTAKLLNRLVERLSCDKVYTMPRDQRDKFFLTGANLLLEGSLDTRSYAKSLFKLLSHHPSYTRLLIEVIPPRTYRNIEKTLKNIH